MNITYEVLLPQEYDAFSKWHASSRNKTIDLSNEHAKVIVAKQKDKYIGFVFFYYISDVIDIIDVFVKVEMRRQGIAMQMFSKLFVKASENDVLEIILEVSENNVNAYNMYTKLGFSIIDTRKKYYDNTYNAYVMKKYLCN